MPGFEILAVDASVVWMKTRIPFRYGIAVLTELPHLFLRVRILPEGEDQEILGVAAEGLLPKWFDKNPETSGNDDLRNMWASIRNAVDGALDARQFASAFGMWRELYEAQRLWGEERHFPALLWHFGVTLVERAVIDALCRHAGAPLSTLLATNAFEIESHTVAPDVSPNYLTSVLSAEPLTRIFVRHTVGMADPLTSDDLTAPLNDGLPETLEEDITCYRLRYFKIKVRGDLEPDVERLSRIAELFERLQMSDYRFSLDGNEQFHDADSFRRFFDAVGTAPRLKAFFSHLLFVEQPFARADALTEDLGAGLRKWKERPPIIIDESDGTIDDAKRALEHGYAGTSYKSCKGVFKGIINAARIQQARARAGVQEGPAAVLSGEDLANVGPVALLQDLAMMAKLRIPHVERNGHHYFRGLSRFSRELQEEMTRHHGDLYEMHTATGATAAAGVDGAGTVAAPEHAFAALRVKDGGISVAGVAAAPFGVIPIPRETEYRPCAEIDCPQIQD